MTKKYEKFGLAAPDYPTLELARGNTYTRRDDSFPSTRLDCVDNPFADRLSTAKYILDFGCGVGRNVSWIMKNTTAKYIGLDPNNHMTRHFWDVQLAEGHSVEEVEQWKERVTLCADFSEIPEGVTFDYVVSTFVIQHLGYRYDSPGRQNLTDITKQIMSRMNKGAVFFALEHDSEENWIPRWLQENNITLNVYIRGYKGLPELCDRDHTAPNGGNHLMIFEV